MCFFFFSSRRRHTRLQGDWSSDVCSSDLFCKARGLFDELVAIHGFGSVVQTRRSEQRAQSPAESRETVSSEKGGFVRETDRAVETKQIQSVVSAKRNINTGHGPAEFDPCGAVKHAVGRGEKQRLCRSQPVREQPAGTQIEEARGLDSATKWDAVFGIRSGDEIRTGRHN